jgi:hypothetical protein
MSPFRGADVQRSATRGCSVCALVRKFLLGVMSLVLLYFAFPEWMLPEGFDYSMIVGDIFLVTFIALLAWRFYQYRKERRVHPGPFDALTWTGRSRHPKHRAKP